MTNLLHRLRISALIVVITAIGCRQQSPSSQQDGSLPLVETNSPADSTRALFELVDHYYKNVEHDSLKALAPKAMNYFRSHAQWKEYYSTWCLLVNDFVWNGEMDQGFEEAQKMHKDAIERNNAFGLSEAYTAMGIAYHFQKNDSESARCYEQALKFYPDDAEQSVKLNIYSYYCQVLVDMADYQTNAQVLEQWEKFLKKLTEGHQNSKQYNHWYFRFHREKYRYYYGTGNYLLAGKELDTMQSFLDKENDREVYEAQVAGFRTQLAVVQRDYANAMVWSDREVELCKHQDFNTFLNALKHRTEMLQTLGHYEEALKAYRDYDFQKDSVIKTSNREQLNELNKRFELDELKAQQERSQLEHEHTQLQLILIFTIIVVIALTLFIFFRNRAAKRLQEAHALLEQSNQELLRSYEQLKVANAKAEESSKMKSNFIRQISHEIRTPLNILSGFTQIVTTPGIELGDEELLDINQRITENTDRITRLVNKMLELSEASSQAVIERKDKVSIIEIATQAIDESGIKQASHISFELVNDEQSLSTILTTNLLQASRALVQILDNAMKFTKEGTVKLVVKTNPEFISFAVEDTGIGFPIYEAEHIFDEFVQLDEYYSGTGIGLAVARSIARRLSGDVMADTSYTSGARFIFILPNQ